MQCDIDGKGPFIAIEEQWRSTDLKLRSVINEDRLADYWVPFDLLLAPRWSAGGPPASSPGSILIAVP
jgi:hypothetical protein